MIRMKKWFRINIIIAALSLLGFWFLDWPLEVFPCIGISWVLISCCEMLRKIHSVNKKTRGVS